MTKWKLKKSHERTWAVFEWEDGYYRAEVKFDGCIEFYHSFNAPLSTDACESILQRLIDQIHICDIDDMIARLQGLKEAAIEFFGDDWK